MSPRTLRLDGLRCWGAATWQLRNACSCPMPGGRGGAKLGLPLRAALLVPSQPGGSCWCQVCLHQHQWACPEGPLPPQARATCIPPLPATSWGAGASGTGMGADRAGRSPEPTSDPRSVSPCTSSLRCPVCGNWESSAKVGPTPLLKIHLCLAPCSYLGQS